MIYFLWAVPAILVASGHPDIAGGGWKGRATLITAGIFWPVWSPILILTAWGK